MKQLALLLAPLALTACANSPPGKAGPTAGFGQVAVIGGVQVRPLALLEDSRCPTNVQECAWLGQVRILVQIGREQREIGTLGKPVVIGGGRLTLVSVEPGQIAGTDIDPSAYRFTFRFEH